MFLAFLNLCGLMIMGLYIISVGNTDLLAQHLDLLLLCEYILSTKGKHRSCNLSENNFMCLRH